MGGELGSHQNCGRTGKWGSSHLTELRRRKPTSFSGGLAGAHGAFRKLRSMIATCGYAIATGSTPRRSKSSSLPARSGAPGMCGIGLWA
jgi:hypothetical protein